MQYRAQRIEPIFGSALLRRVFYAIATLALVSLCLTIAGHYLGHTISLGGHTEDTKPREIVIGNNVLEVPANTIRFERQRRNGDAERVDLYLHWPDMLGYQPAFLSDFNSAGPEKRLLFLTFEPRATSQDMSGRYGPIYSTLTEGPGSKGPAGLTTQKLRADSGFVNEELMVSAEQAGRLPFVARCLDEQTSKTNLASCQRDIFLGEDLQLTYRFPREILGDWQKLDQQIRTFAEAHLKGQK
ncbi:hypothetical protein [Phyllobacterium zundukense]|uniref:Uncharacterized protein n=1 Tax=Phyllobacterium zundukense TaxID=1867719 RepID=A0ACD4D2P1_9HYPH|nr:hypothetical protein [Phyllobacterium zundukense]UXN60076.1 hypothetical protein N8E88_26625 [Phyllobacterium zundukense]